VISPNVLVSVVIPTYNRRYLLPTIITPLLSDPGTGEIVVVVDGSADGSFEFLQQWALKEPLIKPLFIENCGESVARRRGVESARFDIVLLLDDDVEALPGLVTGHAERHRGEEKLVVLGYMPSPQPARPPRGFAPNTLYGSDYESTCQFYENNPELIFTRFWAGNVSLRRENALSVGDANEVRLDYHEDLRFGLQCQHGGFTAAFDRSLASRHLHRRNLRQFSRDCRRSGAGRVQISREFPDIADVMNPLHGGTPSEDWISQHLGTSTFRPVVAPLSMSVSFVSGRLKLRRLEMMSLRLLRMVVTADAYRRAGGLSLRPAGS
jgi:GT2 family glycosyltransferase